jgi:archaellum component FlaC
MSDVEELKQEIQKLRDELKEQSEQLRSYTYYYTNITPYIQPLTGEMEDLDKIIRGVAKNPVKFLKKDYKRNKTKYDLLILMLLCLGYLFFALLLSAPVFPSP